MQLLAVQTKHSGQSISNFPFKRALITGASSGIGEEMAHILGRAGIPMVLVARRGERLQALAQQYSNVEVLVADLLRDEEVAKVTARIADTSLPEIDLVVNNAGFGTSGSMHRIDADRLANEVKLNVIALTRLTHAAANAMRTRKHGYILNVSSVASFQASPGLAVYSATKAYVTSFTEGVAMELRSSGITVTALCPGLTKTEFQQNSNTTGAATSMPAFAWTSVSMVAKAGLEGVAKGKVIVVPGGLYKVLVAISNSVPRAVSRKITQLITKRV